MPRHFIKIMPSDKQHPPPPSNAVRHYRDLNTSLARQLESCKSLLAKNRAERAGLNAQLHQATVENYRLRSALQRLMHPNIQQPKQMKCGEKDVVKQSMEPDGSTTPVSRERSRAGGWSLRRRILSMFLVSNHSVIHSVSPASPQLEDSQPSSSANAHPNPTSDFPSSTIACTPMNPSVRPRSRLNRLATPAVGSLRDANLRYKMRRPWEELKYTVVPAVNFS